MFTCPVCYYDNMPDPPEDYNICPSCGTEFENDDAVASHAELRNRWITGGARWFFRQPPVGWNAWEQLQKASFVGARTIHFIAQSTFSVESGRTLANYRYGPGRTSHVIVVVPDVIAGCSWAPTGSYTTTNLEAIGVGSLPFPAALATSAPETDSQQQGDILPLAELR